MAELDQQVDIAFAGPEVVVQGGTEDVHVGHVVALAGSGDGGNRKLMLFGNSL